MCEFERDTNVGSITQKYVATKGGDGDGLLGNGGYILMSWQTLKGCHFLNVS